MVIKISVTLLKWSKYRKYTRISCCFEYRTSIDRFNMDVRKLHDNNMLNNSKKELVVHVEKLKIKRLVVLLENCFTDVPKPSKSCEQDLSLSNEEQLLPKTLATTTNVDEEYLSNSVSSSESISYASEDHVSSSDPVEQTTQTLSFSESMLLHVPISTTFDNEQVGKTVMLEDESMLCWEKLAEPQICDVKTPHTSGSSSVVDLELTPPSSVTSRCLSEDTSTSFDDSFMPSFDTLLEETDEIEAKRQVLRDNCLCKDLRIGIVNFEPTLRQLQVLYRRNRSLRTDTQNYCRKGRLRPSSSLKQFVPFMFEQTENHKKNYKVHQMQTHRSKTSQSRVFHSTPNKAVRKLPMDSNGGKKKIKVASKEKKANEMKQLKFALKQKEANEKKQLKLALTQKKNALKHRNKYDNALDSINKRIYNQNTFWRMLPR